MRIGVPKEIKNNGDRAGLTPSSVRELTHAGHQLLVQAGSGQGINEDVAYENAGATIVSIAAEGFACAEMIVKVKEPQHARCATVPYHMGEPLIVQDTKAILDPNPFPDELHDVWHFHAITNARAHEEVVKQITFAILSGTCQPGERLPNIEQLSLAMGVSKPVVGEALKVLAKEKIVRVQRGSSGGVFVLTDNVPDHVMALTTPLRHLSLSEIIEARHPIELQLALLAGERATETDFQTMQTCINRLGEHRKSALTIRIRFDHLFHYTIARAARSGALALYQHQILEQLFVRMNNYFMHNEDVDRVIAEHQHTLDAIRSRKPARIKAAIAQHMRHLEDAIALSKVGQC